MAAGWWFGGTEAMVNLTEPVIEFMVGNLRWWGVGLVWTCGG